jgi:hypothetical protein
MTSTAEHEAPALDGQAPQCISVIASLAWAGWWTDETD